MRRKGQSTLEYVIVLAVVIAAITAIARGALKTNVDRALTNAADRIGQEAEQLKN